MMFNCFQISNLTSECKDSIEFDRVHSKGDQSWVFFGRNDAKAETLVLWPPHVKSWLIGKDSDAGEGLGAGGEGGDRGCDAWMASPTRWTWVWVNSGSWWWTGRPGVLQFMGSQRIGHDWVTELNWTELKTLLAITGIFKINVCVLQGIDQICYSSEVSLVFLLLSLHWKLIHFSLNISCSLFFWL